MCIRDRASIGIHVTRGVTMHGLAINVNTDLSYFDNIISCGIQGVKMTSLDKELGKKIRMNDIKKNLIQDIKDIKVGDPEDFNNFMNAVIEKKAFKKITSYIDDAKKDSDLELLVGGNYDDSKGYFIDPTVFITKNPNIKLMEEEVFGPVTCIYIYEDENSYFIQNDVLFPKTFPFLHSNNGISVSKLFSKI